MRSRLACRPSVRSSVWCLDNWDALAAEIAAAQNVSLGVASHQLMIARALRDRLPGVAEVSAAGHIAYRVVNAIVFRTRVDHRRRGAGQGRQRVGRRGPRVGSLSIAKVEAAIDYW